MAGQVVITDPAVELARRVRMTRQQAESARRAAIWSEHDAYGCAARGLLRQARGLEGQADRQRALADELEAEADALEMAL